MFDTYEANMFVYNMYYTKQANREDIVWNMISQVFLIAEDLNEYFTLVFTREETRSLPLPEAKFKVAESCLKMSSKI